MLVSVVTLWDITLPSEHTKWQRLGTLAGMMIDTMKSTALKAHDIFTPNGYPAHTYVVRAGRNYEQSLAKYMNIANTIVAVAGPSKSGKTILVRRVVGDSNLLVVPCGGINSTDTLWERVLDRLKLPQSSSTSVTQTKGTNIGGEIAGPFLFPTTNNVAKVNVQWTRSIATNQSVTMGRRGLSQVTELLAGQDVVVLFDDFHFIPRAVQASIAEQLKAASQDGVRIAITVAAHRSDDLERATSQLAGRVANLDILPWSKDELLEIAYEGFPKLNIAGSILLPHELVREAAGSPQLMQLLCLFTAIHCGFESAPTKPRGLSLTSDDVQKIMPEATALTQKRTVSQIMLNGPKSRGTHRDTFILKDGTKGDVYYCIAKVLVQDPPGLDLQYDDIKNRIQQLVKGTPPGGASITSALEQMSELTKEPTTGERELDWDADKRQFSVVDPYLWFYLRWSNFLSKELEGR